MIPMLNIAGPGGREQGFGRIPMRLQHPKSEKEIIGDCANVRCDRLYSILLSLKRESSRILTHVENVWDEKRFRL